MCLHVYGPFLFKLCHSVESAAAWSRLGRHSQLNPPMNPTRRPADARRAFTIVEMRVVISLITLLISMLLPSLQTARLAGERTQCLSNMGQTGRALHAFITDSNGVLPGPSWYGQEARYSSGSKTVARWLAPYSGFPQASATVRVNQLFICPSFARVQPEGTTISACVIMGAMSQTNAQGLRVFGYPAFNSDPEYGPDKFGAVKNPSTAKALRDIDQYSNPTAGWVDITARAPMHSPTLAPETMRNYLYFDTHAATVREPLATP